MAINYSIEEIENQPKCLIKNVKVHISPDGQKATVAFSMNYHVDYHYCMVFDVSEEEYRNGINLIQLLQDKRDIDIIDRKVPYDHVVNLCDDGVRCMLFAARREGDTYYVQNQKEDNVSEPLRLLPTIICGVRYESLLVGKVFKRESSKSKKAIIQISGKKRPVDGTYIFYRCVRAGREGIRFGIDVHTFWGAKFEIVIRKNEEIHFIEPEDKSYLLKVL